MIISIRCRWEHRIVKPNGDGLCVEKYLSLQQCRLLCCLVLGGKQLESAGSRQIHHQVFRTLHGDAHDFSHDVMRNLDHEPFHMLVVLKRGTAALRIGITTLRKVLRARCPGLIFCAE
jgi:hypothetical protein